MTQRIAVIMAGGAGERFWPMSRRNHPKQILALAGKQTMLSLAIERIEPLVPPENLYIVTSKHLQEKIAAQTPQIPPQNIIGEPISRNTAACLGMALAHTGITDTAPAMAVLTADHVIDQTDCFLADVEAAFTAAEQQDSLVTIGIPPARAETGFGYIEMGEMLDGCKEANIHRVRRFHEKPDAPTAHHYMESGRFLWNSGMFFWKNVALFDAFRKHMPDLAAGVEKIHQALIEGQGDEVAAQVFANLEKISIDNGVMEQADNVLCLRASFEWDDIGSWEAMTRLHSADPAGNVILGKALPLRTQNSIICSNAGEDAPLVATLGVENVIVVVSKDAVLVCSRDDAPKIKEIVQALKDQGLEQLT